MPRTKRREPERILVLCVDRDDDIGVKAGVKTPVIGRKQNVNAATSLALRDPEEPDANAIFEAVRIFDHLKESTAVSPEEYQIATIAGSELGGVGADRQLVSELIEVLETFPASDVILVTDGYTDEAVLPLVESRVPVTSVRRIVMKHSRSIEETAAVFTRYLKLLAETPRYSRILLGIPGFLLIVLAVLVIFNWLEYATIALLIVLGGALFARGFGIDKAVRNLYKWIREYSPPPYPVQIASFSAVAGALLVVVGCYLGSVTITDAISQISPPLTDIGSWLAHSPELLGHFVAGSIALIVIGICVGLTGRAIRWFFERDNRLWRTIVIVVVIAWSWSIFQQTSQILIDPAFPTPGLVIAIISGLPITVIAVFIAFRILRRKYAVFFTKKAEATIEDSEED